MNDNNYRYLEVDEFVAIIQGERDRYYLPQTANLKASYMFTSQAMKASGIEPDVYIQVPDQYVRNRAMFEHNMKSKPGQYWPDFDDPIVHVIKNSIYWNRGYNTSSGEGIKSTLKYHIDLLNCQFNGDFSMNTVKSTASFRLNSCKFIISHFNNYDSGGNLSIYSSDFKRVELINLSSIDDNIKKPLRRLHISNLTTEELSIIDCHIDALIIDCSQSEIKKISLQNSTIQNIEIKGRFCDEVNILNLKNNETLNISGQYKKFEMKVSNIDGEIVLDNESFRLGNALFEFTNQVDKGRYEIKHLNINSCHIKGISNGGIYVRNSTINNITVEDFTNIGDFSLHDVKVLSQFIIKDSSLSKAEFIDVDVKKANIVQIVLSNISEIILINTAFPDTLYAEHRKDYRGNREIYRQLKLSAYKQNNRIDELRYESLEMDSYENDKSDNKSFVNKFILFTNKWSNNHGQDWFRAVTLLFIFTSVAYIIIKYSQGYRFGFGWPDLNQTSQYLNFALNPLHDFDKLFGPSEEDGSLMGIARLTDSVAKLIAGYLIFQFLRAFRKFVK